MIQAKATTAHAKALRQKLMFWKTREEAQVPSGYRGVSERERGRR